MAAIQRGSVLEASDQAAGDSFGRSVSLSDDGLVLVVSANAWEGASGTDRGGVYTFDKNGTGWTQRGSVLEAADAADSDGFGIDVEISGDGLVLAVGASSWEGSAGVDPGGVYIYDKDGSGWTQRGSVLEASDAANTDAFGGSVSLSYDGSVLAVGAIRWEGAAGSGRGGVYIYDRNGSGWTQRGSVLEASDAADDDGFGRSVSLTDDGLVLVVSANDWEGAAGSNRGGVYIYDRNGSGWTQRGSILEAGDAADSDAFGIDVEISGDGLVLAVGASNWEGASGSNRGGVYLYDKNGSGWTQRGSVLEAGDAADSDAFGVSVTFGGVSSVLAVGALTWEDSATLNTGGAYLYDLIIKGSLAATESGSDSASAEGSVEVAGSLAATETGADSFAADGSVSGSGISGDLAATESGADTVSAAGSVAVAGSLEATETGSDTASADATVEVSGDMSVTEAGSDTASAAGSVEVSGDMAASETGTDTASAAGSVEVAGSLAATESGADTFSATGSNLPAVYLQLSGRPGLESYGPAPGLITSDSKRGLLDAA
jgi:hypothetical protein